MVAVPPSAEDSLLLPAVSAAAVVIATALLARNRYATSPPLEKLPEDKPLRKPHTLPHPRFVVGDLFEYVRNAERFHDWLTETSLQFHNEPWCLRIVGQSELVVLSTPEALEDVLVKQSELFPRGEYANSIYAGVFGRSLLNSDGEEWHRQRKTAAKFFTAKALRICMTTTMRKNVAQMYEVLDAHAASGEALDLSHLLDRFTLQTFTEVGLGITQRWIGTDAEHPIKEAEVHGSSTLMRRFRVPAFWWKLERLLNIGAESRLTSTMATTREWLHRLIDDSLEAIAEKQRDLGEHSVNAEDTVKGVVELFFEHSQEDATGLRPEDMVDFILTFVLSAQDTSAITLTRFFLMLMSHPCVAKRVREEMATVLPRLGVTEATYLTTEHVQHLVYLEATIKEVLRLYPTGPLIQREAAANTVIYGDVAITKGTMVGLSLFAMARNPDVWGPDAAEFKPDRWIDAATGELLVVPPTKFASFGAGPHLCIGMKLGMLEVRVVTANVLHRYALSLAAPNDGDYLVGITLSMKHPLMVHVGNARADIA